MNQTRPSIPRASAAELPVCRIRGMTKRYGGRTVLDHVDLDLMRGQVKALIGPSGTGKSTLLRLIALLEEPDAGTIEVAGREIGYVERRGARRWAPERVRVRQREPIGMVFQSFNLFPHLTAGDNVAMALRRGRGVPKEEAAQRAETALIRVGLGHRISAYPRELSGGEQQRVAIARTVVLEPDLLLFDEPTSALDPGLTREVLTVMAELAREHRTMLVITHELAFAERVADSIAVFTDGGIIEEGPPAQVLRASADERTRRFLAHEGAQA